MEKNMKRNTYMYNWITLLHSNGWCNIINQLYFNKQTKNTFSSSQELGGGSGKLVKNACSQIPPLKPYWVKIFRGEASESAFKDDCDSGLNDSYDQLRDVRNTSLPYSLNVSDVALKSKHGGWPYSSMKSHSDSLINSYLFRDIFGILDPQLYNGLHLRNLIQQ